MRKNRRTIDPNEIPKISKPQMDEKIHLGPRAQVSWVKGSSGGAKASDSELPRTAGPNRFSVLQPPPHLNPPPVIHRTQTSTPGEIWEVAAVQAESAARSR
ncbi:eukaryotic translation initiation factor 4 gamma 3-like [Hippoglossus hippoglossus]|uniref:eukaryotic translation initiation factor 4 gamma 3-like n=1 Tax=Hippoglossus hippoglossus TaxID=8267 RepID=UPI00148DC710|nr:eukaryotic translation initiation factor 4 gamma 3-like [Hippoglossus hippoglossus]